MLKTHDIVKLYNSRGLLEPPEANVAIGRAGAEMDGIEMDGRTDDDGDMWNGLMQPVYDSTVG